MNRVLFVFLDGVGLGPAGEHNPLSTEALPAFRRLAGGQPWTDAAKPFARDGHLFRPIDATLGVDGLPQSGTGQATLFTGTNCAERAGHHFGPFPHSSSHPVIAERNVFHRVQRLRPEADTPAAFANAYPPRFFEHARERDRWTVTTRCCRAAGVRLRSTADLRAGHALAADLTADGWRRHLALDVPRRSPAEAGRHLLRLSRRHAFCLFEYYLTDKAGHGRGHYTPASVLGNLDAFFAAVLEDFRPAEELLLVTSDHGNLDDCSTKTHTRHPVPLLAYGHGARAFDAARDLADVTPAVADAVGTGTPAAAGPREA